jgi:hypothetical protein
MFVMVNESDGKMIDLEAKSSAPDNWNWQNQYNQWNTN